MEEGDSNPDMIGSESNDDDDDDDDDADDDDDDLIVRGNLTQRRTETGWDHLDLRQGDIYRREQIKQ